jgi:hypothetical protein
MMGSLGRLALCLLVFAGLALRPAISEPEGDLAGTWKLDGKNGVGHYTGNVTLTKDNDKYVAAIAYTYDDAKQGDGTARVTGTFDGHTLTGQRLRTTGLTGVLDGVKRKPVPASYRLSQDGLTLTGSYAGFHESFKRDKVPVAAKATVTADPLLTFVPGAPGTVFGSVHVEVQQGTVKLVASPADALKFTVTPESLETGSYDFKVEALKEGPVEVQLLADTTVIAKAPIDVQKEKLYLVVFGYMGPEVNFLESDMTKAKSHVLPKLESAGFSVIEDGPGYKQETIDGMLTDPKTPKKVIVDWCTTTADWNKYFDRGTVKGYIWSSHGFMEPYPGCPDSELKAFESRQWTCVENDPSETQDRHFIRDWRAKFEKNAYSMMDFGLNHACCTGGLGDYQGQPWEYTELATQVREKKLFGTLPSIFELTFTTHDSLKGHFNFQQNFNGSSYFGMTDVRWDELEAAIAP